MHNTRNFTRKVVVSYFITFLIPWVCSVLRYKLIVVMLEFTIWLKIFRLKINNFVIMKVALVLLLVNFSAAEMIMRCSNVSETSMTFSPSKGPVLGRYTAELCTETRRDVTVWKLDLLLNNAVNCTYAGRNRHPGKLHSRYEKDVNFTNLNCSHVSTCQTNNTLYS